MGRASESARRGQSLPATRQREGDREAERPRDRETERQRDRETERQRDRETERQIDFLDMNCLIVWLFYLLIKCIFLVICPDRLTDRQTVRQTDRQADRQKGRRT